MAASFNLRHLIRSFIFREALAVKPYTTAYRHGTENLRLWLCKGPIQPQVALPKKQLGFREALDRM